MARHNKTGRSKGDAKHVRLYEFMERTDAWKNLSGNAAKAWLTIGLMHTGFNNGKIAISCRELGRRIGVHHTTAASAIRELVNAGFLRKTKSSDFGKKRLAAEYRLTHILNDITGERATRDFMRGLPANEAA